MEPTASILAGLLALAFLAAGGAKLVGADQMVTILRGLGVGEGLQRAIGALEVLAAAGLVLGFVVEGTGVAAAVGLVLLMSGAVSYHVRAGQGPREFGPPALLGLLALTFVVLRLAA